MIGLPSGLQSAIVAGAIEELRLAIVPERCPVAADDAVMGNDGLEDAAIVVGAVGMLRRKHDVAALVADEVFVVGRNQQVFALAETPYATVIRQIELPTLPLHGMNRVA